MAAGGGFFHQLRVMLTNPAEEEARDLDIAFAEDVEQASEVFLDVRRQSRPFGNRRGAGKIQDMKPIFDVDGKNGSLHDRPLASFRYITISLPGTSKAGRRVRVAFGFKDGARRPYASERLR